MTDSDGVVAPAVLVVESHDDTREMYGTFLQARGFAVLTAATTNEAFALMDQADVLVTALRVRGTPDAVALMHNAHRRTPKLPVILVSAYVNDAAEVASADVFLQKPCEPLILEAEIRKVVEIGRA